jgi:hypothetical protein
LEYKAFLFDYASFDRELRPFLENALATNDSQRLVEFINENLDSLTDPYEGEPLGSDWRSKLEYEDPHQFGDFAITKYYDPRADLGVGADWEELQQFLLQELGTDEPLLGRPVGPPNNLFDPGKAGSYFQSEEQVRENLARLQSIGSPTVPGYDRLQTALQTAADAGRGLYVTF